MNNNTPIIAISSFILGALCAYLYFTENEKPYIDRYIEELRYETEQQNRYENAQIQDKLNGQENHVCQKTDGQKDE